MFDSTPYFLQAEMDYRAEKLRRGVAVRRHRHRKPLVRSRAQRPGITN
jgi:hypothetical protein